MGDVQGGLLAIPISLLFSRGLYEDATFEIENDLRGKQKEGVLHAPPFKKNNVCHTGAFT